jgi:hypothetical protein
MSAASVKEYEGRNWDGFFNSGEYVKFANSMQGLTGDQKVYESPYFGNITGSLFGSGIDEAFENFQEQIQNPGKVPFRMAPIGLGLDISSKSSGIHWLLLAAAAAYVLS